jgi:hypothetical protein
LLLILCRSPYGTHFPQIRTLLAFQGEKNGKEGRRCKATGKWE